VTNLQQSLYFYHILLKFPLLTRPAFDFPGAWLDIGDNRQLHLIQVERLERIDSGSRALHFAFQTNAIDLWKSELVTFGLTIAKDTIRPDGVRQLFLFDPDGYCIELCEATP
jgi:catechol 2,3-dioxygenase-like lactoylglutathione lyase family enzyme